MRPPLRPSRALLQCFDIYLRFYYRKHFHGLHVAGMEHWPAHHGPLLICLNHPSWWDPLTCILLSRRFEKAANHYAPMDAKAAERYGVLQKLGLFPVEQGTARGAAQFLRAAASVLEQPGAVLWVTPQGEFTDARTRPVIFRAGIDALVRRTQRLTVLPLALEYSFWNERLPEALAMVGQPLQFADGKLLGEEVAEHSAGELIAAALGRTQDELAQLAARRSSALFTPVLSGSTGTGGIYGRWQRMRAWASGETFSPEHDSLHAETGRSDG